MCTRPYMSFACAVSSACSVHCQIYFPIMPADNTCQQFLFVHLFLDKDPKMSPLST